MVVHDVAELWSFLLLFHSLLYSHSYALLLQIILTHIHHSCCAVNHHHVVLTANVEYASHLVAAQQAVCTPTNHNMCSLCFKGTTTTAFRKTRQQDTTATAVKQRCRQNTTSAFRPQVRESCAGDDYTYNTAIILDTAHSHQGGWSWWSVIEHAPPSPPVLLHWNSCCALNTKAPMLAWLVDPPHTHQKNPPPSPAGMVWGACGGGGTPMHT